MRQWIPTAAAGLLILGASAFAELQPAHIVTGGAARAASSAYSLTGFVGSLSMPFNQTSSSGGPYVLRDSFLPAAVAYVPNRNSADEAWLDLGDAPDLGGAHPVPARLHRCNLIQEWTPSP